MRPVGRVQVIESVGLCGFVCEALEEMAFDVTVLVDDRPGGETLIAEGGMSLLVQGDCGSLLIDTGATGEVLEHNSDALGVDLSAVENVVLTHGHADHGGGLSKVMKLVDGACLHCGAGAFAGRYVEPPGEGMKDVSVPLTPGQVQALGGRIVEVRSPVRLNESAILSGPVGGAPFGVEGFAVRRGDELVQDHFSDEMFVMVRGGMGWVVICGCCHRGLFNTLHLAKFLVHNENISAVLGGLHLRSCNQGQLQDVANFLQDAGRPDLFLGHCTGERAEAFFAENYEGLVKPLAVGDNLHF